MKIVIIGGTGFTGKELWRTLEKEHEVIVASRRRPKVEQTKYWEFMDLAVPHSVFPPLEGADLVYHLAAYGIPPSLGEQNPRILYQTNIMGTLNVLLACKQEKARLVFTTSYASKALDSHYAISKKTNEEMIKHFSKKGLNGVIAMLPSLYGPTQREGFVVPDLIRKLKNNSKELVLRGSGKDVRNFLYIEDVIDSLIFLGKKGKAGKMYEVGSDDEMTTLELAQRISRTMMLSPKIKVDKTLNVSPTLYHIDKSEITKLGWKARWNLKRGLKECIARAKDIKAREDV